MRKILLATTAIVALSAGSAMAADITISGGFEFGYNDDSVNAAAAQIANNDGTSYTAEQDVNINFSSTTDSGLTMSMSMGLHEDGNNDDANASLSGDFGTIGLIFNGLDDDVLEGMDIAVDAATSEEGQGGPAANLASYAGGFSATAGNSISYTLPTLVEGLKIAGASANGAADADSSGIGASYTTAAAGASVTLSALSSTVGANAAADTTRNHYGISITTGDVTLMAESNNMDDGSAADYSSTGVGGTYTMGALKFGAYSRTAKDGTAANDYSQTAWGVDYTVAPGLTASVTQTSTDVSSTVSTDRTRASLKMAF
jgi:hypothetical protein